MTEIIKYQPGLLGKLANGGFSLDVFSRDILLLSTDIAGLMHQDPYEILEAVVTGDLLQLKREPANEHDNLAIAVWKGSIKCGYVPRKKNEVLARLMDAGKTVFAKVVEIDEEDESWIKIRIEVFLRG